MVYGICIKLVFQRTESCLKKRKVVFRFRRKKDVHVEKIVFNNFEGIMVLWNYYWKGGRVAITDIASKQSRVELTG